jgi:hypothetical protein
MRRLCSTMWICLSCVMAAVAVPVAAEAQVICVSNAMPPPELPVYEQPPIPEPGYMWVPGYWAGGPTGYFWVPGTWVLPPAAGLLWTPGYWGWRDGIYVWNAGYWGPHVGFYGGIDYGFGYTGAGYFGGRWDHGVFAYNRTVNNFGGVTIVNVYEQKVVVDPRASRVSFNGGSGGIAARPTAQEEAAAREQHVAAVPTQFQHERTASSNKALFASENHGMPPVAATAKPGEFTGKGVVAAREEKPGAKPGAPTGSNPMENKNLENKNLENKSIGTTNKGPEPVQRTDKGQPPSKELNTETKHPGNEANTPKVEDKRANVSSKPAAPQPPKPTSSNPQERTATAPKPHPAPPPPKPAPSKPAPKEKKPE